MISYAQFLKSKAIVARPAGIKEPQDISERLFPFQRACEKWALQRGKSALFLGTGLGKTPIQGDWAAHVEEYTQKPVLILAPLAVSHQTIELVKNVLGLEIKFAEHGAQVGDRGIYVTNYQKLDRFHTEVFGGVVWDESSILKSVDGKTRAKILEAFAQTPFRLACTATPAPNDYMELGQHAEALGVMKASEMLATFFVHDGGETQKWRLKRHAEKGFWQWLASWCICAQKPSDIGFSDEGFVLSPLTIHDIIVDIDAKPLPGELFAMPARTLQERRGARRVSVNERVEKLASIIDADQSFTADEQGRACYPQWLVWCNLNAEAESIAKECKMQNVTGSDEDEFKQTMMLKFAKGDLIRLASKPTIAGYGMNWQNCHKMAFLGLSDSWEQMYQAVRRCWRYGQKHPVDVYVVISSQETAVLQNIKRKEADAQRMQAALVEHMSDLTRKQFSATVKTTTEYKPKKRFEVPAWL